MVTYTLTPGDHTIEWSLDGYQPLTATINVSSTGVLSCISVIGNTCADLISIVGSTITGMLKEIVVPVVGVCSWILEKGGWEQVATFDIMELVQGYLLLKDLGFTVTTAHIMGTIAYYNNQLSSGNALTGCEFT